MFPNGYVADPVGGGIIDYLYSNGLAMYSFSTTLRNVYYPGELSEIQTTFNEFMAALRQMIATISDIELYT